MVSVTGKVCGWDTLVQRLEGTATALVSGRFYGRWMVMASAQLGCGPPHNPQSTFSTICTFSQTLPTNPLFPPPPALLDCQACSEFEHEPFIVERALLPFGTVAIIVGGPSKTLRFLMQEDSYMLHGVAEAEAGPRTSLRVQDLQMFPAQPEPV